MSAPSYEQLIDFAAGELRDKEEAAQVASHVQRHPDAAAVVHAWQSVKNIVTRDDSVEPSLSAMQRAKAIFGPRAASALNASTAAAWIETAQRMIARLVYDSRVQPAAVRFSGVDDRINLTFATDSGEIDLQAERVANEDSAENRWRIVGQISDASVRSHAVALAARDSKLPPAITTADEHGVFAFEAMSGAYDVLIQAGTEAQGDECVTVLSPLLLP